jgi:ATP-dependent Lon protease
VKNLEKMIQDYTRESGVRELDRHLAAVMRYQAKQLAMTGALKAVLTIDDIEKILGKPRFSNDYTNRLPSQVWPSALAYTQVGGDILFIEAILSDGKPDLRLTGNLGEVMKESAVTALSYLSANAKKFGMEPTLFEKKAVHIHVPEGAVPKDGPSAGVTMLTALASAFTGKRSSLFGYDRRNYPSRPGAASRRHQGKVLAAKRAGLKDVILCWQNQKDIEEINPGLYQRCSVPLRKNDERGAGDSVAGLSFTLP